MSLIERWAARWRWQDRLAAWYRRVDAERDRNWVADLNDMLDCQVGTAILIQEKVLERLQRIDVNTIKPGDLVKLWTAAVAVRRTAYGLKAKLEISEVERVEPERHGIK